MSPDTAAMRALMECRIVAARAEQLEGDVLSLTANWVGSHASTVAPAMRSCAQVRAAADRLEIELRTVNAEDAANVARIAELVDVLTDLRDWVLSACATFALVRPLALARATHVLDDPFNPYTQQKAAQQ